MFGKKKDDWNSVAEGYRALLGKTFETMDGMTLIERIRLDPEFRTAVHGFCNAVRLCQHSDEEQEPTDTMHWADEIDQIRRWMRDA